MVKRIEPQPLQRRRLLIVQKDALVCRSLARCLRPLVGTVSVAANEAEAEEILRDPDRSPTDLLCGQDLGEGSLPGSQLVAKWRAEHNTLSRVVLATGAFTLPDELSGVDVVVRKPADITEILSGLLV